MSTRRFELHRADDPTVLAEGCVWTGGSVTLCRASISGGTGTVTWATFDSVILMLDDNPGAEITWIDERPGYCGDRARHRSHRWPDPEDGPGWCDGVRENCPHCVDGHGDPASRSWGVYVAADRDGDGQPVRLHVGPSNGAHVAESDAVWLRDLIRRNS